MKPFHIISVPKCPPNQRRLCVIGLLYMLASIVVFLVMVSGCYISWHEGHLEIGEGTKLVVPK